MCQSKPLASAGSFRLDSCHHCDSLSVHLGPITVRLDPTALRALHRLLGEAIQQIDPSHEDTCSLRGTPLTPPN